MLKCTKFFVSGFSMVLIAAVAVTVGCDSQNKGKKTGDAAAASHDHGPNDGELIAFTEPGAEFVAEMVHNEKNDVVTIYLFETDLKTAKPIEAEAVTIEITHEGNPATFTLPAKPAAGESDGKSSKFESSEQPLSLALQNEKAERKLHVKIGDKTHSQTIEHFDHHHDHDHDHEEGHDKDGHDKHDDHKDDHDEKTAPPAETPKT